MDNITKVLKDVPTELFYVFIGAIALYLIEKAYSWIKRSIAKKKIHHEIETYKRSKESIKVLDLANGVPEFYKDDIKIRETEKCLYINMSIAHKELLEVKESSYSFSKDQRSEFQPDHSFDGSDNFRDLETMTNIPNLCELIEKHRKIVGEQYLDASGGLCFNAKKYGIFDIRFTRFTEKEKSGLEIDLFNTDYFTHRVFRSIYHEIKENKNLNIELDRNNYLQFRPFFTSFGINTLLICNGAKGKEIVFSLRSARVAGAQSLYHITMNEGINKSDIDKFGIIDLEQSLIRGLQEELGINEKIYQHRLRSAFYDLFLDMGNFEIGISSILELDLSFERDIEPLIGRDKSWEFDIFVTLPFKYKNIHEFIHQNDFVPYALYIIDRVLIRENISNKSILL